MNRIIGLSFVAALSSASMASFDLLLIPGVDGRIYRHDPVNQINLGSFNGGSGQLIAANSGGRAISGSIGGSIYRTYDYSTGENLGQLSLTTVIQSVDLLGTTAFYLSGNTVSRKDVVTGSLLSSVSLTSTNISWETGWVNSSYYTAVGIDTTTNAVVVQQIDLGTNTAFALQATTDSVLAGTTLGKAAFVSNSLTNSSLFCYTKVSAANLLSATRVNTGFNGRFVGAATTSFSISGATQYLGTNLMPAFTTAHNGVWLVGEDFTGGAATTRISRFDMGTTILSSETYTFSALGGGLKGSISGGFIPANVVAPEPGSMVALAAGLVAVLRRCRR